MELFYVAFHSATLDAVLAWDIHRHYPDALTSDTMVQCRTMLDLAAGQAVQPVVQRRIASMSRYFTATELHVAARDAMVAWRTHRIAALEIDARNKINATINYIGSVSDEFYLGWRVRPLNEWLTELTTSAVVGRHIFFYSFLMSGIVIQSLRRPTVVVGINPYGKYQ